MQYEIEIKSLLGNKEAADRLLEKAKLLDPKTRLVSEQHQLNHYFKNGDLKKLTETLSDFLTDEQQKNLNEIIARATHINVRSREKNGKTIFIVKGSLDDVSAVHSHQRMEFEAPLDMTIDELDKRITDSGWELEAKWQADRQLYESMGLTLDMFFTPGYGYMIEFERVVADDTDRETAHKQVVDVMEQLDVKELPNDRLERMFAYYNNHWAEYYGTNKIFVVE